MTCRDMEVAHSPRQSNEAQWHFHFIISHILKTLWKKYVRNWNLRTIKHENKEIYEGVFNRHICTTVLKVTWPPFCLP